MHENERSSALKKEEFCIENEEFCIENEEFCIENEEFCITNDEFCRGLLGGATVGPLIDLLRAESKAKREWGNVRGHLNVAQLFSRTALVAVGKPAVASLLKVLGDDSEDWQVRFKCVLNAF